MAKPKVEHFDCEALVRAVNSQPIGLRVSTNHPEGFRRVLYLHLRRNPQLGRLHIIQCPKSANAFLLVKEGFELRERAA